MLILQRIFLFLGLMLISISAYAQSGTATIASTDSPIVLDVSDDVLYEKWDIDISELGFSSMNDAKYYFDMCTDNLLRYEIIWDEQRAIMLLALSYRSNWTLSDWETYVFNKMGQ